MSEHHRGESPSTREWTGQEGAADAPRSGGAPHAPGSSLDSEAPEPVAAGVPRARHLLRDRWDVLLVIAAGGALGSLAREALTTAIPYGHGDFAWATLGENVTGAFVLGMLMVFFLDVWPTTRYLRPFLGVGVLGGYTTFSTYMLDTRMMLVGGHVPAAFAYLFGTLVTGLLAVWAGVLAARATVRAIERRHRRRHRETGHGAEPEPSDPRQDPSPESPPRSSR